jgi:ribosomal protein S18 acetylase RimI-like enzyme
MIFEPVPSDALGEIADIINGAYRGKGDPNAWTGESHLVAGDRITAEELTADLAANPQALVLGVRANRDTPWLGSVWVHPVDETTWYLGLLAVRPGGQNTGLGRRVLSAAEAFAKARGAERMRLTVIHVREELIAWYERRGYQRSGASEPFPTQYTTLQDGLLLLEMIKPL